LFQLDTDILFLNFRQLGHKGVSKLVPLVQGLSHQIHLFLVEYNRCNHLPSNLPGYKPRTLTNNTNNNNNNIKTGVQVPEEILHQQRLLLQSCDRLKLSVSRHQVKVLFWKNLKCHKKLFLAFVYLSFFIGVV
jgi:hypothetical protein